MKVVLLHGHELPTTPRLLARQHLKPFYAEPLRELGLVVVDVDLAVLALDVREQRREAARGAVAVEAVEVPRLVDVALLLPVYLKVVHHSLHGVGQVLVALLATEWVRRGATAMNGRVLRRAVVLEQALRRKDLVAVVAAVRLDHLDVGAVPRGVRRVLVAVVLQQRLRFRKRSSAHCALHHCVGLQRPRLELGRVVALHPQVDCVHVVQQVHVVFVVLAAKVAQPNAQLGGVGATARRRRGRAAFLLPGLLLMLLLPMCIWLRGVVPAEHPRARRWHHLIQDRRRGDTPRRRRGSAGCRCC
eukprot:PhM_4_TR5030/c0_g1_i1/m.57011